MKEKIINVILIFLMAMSSISLGFIARDEINSLIRKVTSKEVETPDQCANLSMMKTAHCLNDYVNSIFIYKETKDIEKLTLDELKEVGGDCKNWAELYMDFTEDLGFNAEGVVIYTSEESRHAFAVISDKTGYCILDQMSVECFKLDY